MLEAIPCPRTSPSSGNSLNVLLVSRDIRWSDAVSDAASSLGLGVGGLSSCDASGALARLSGSGFRYSHLLIEPGSADGLIGALADVTSQPAGSATEMLVLGALSDVPRGTGMIATRTAQAIRAALAARPTPHPDQEGAVLPSELREALAGAMIETRYQPIVAISDRRLYAVEALARLNHPTRGTLAPDRFVPQMEDAGLAAQLTEIVSRHAFADIAGPVLRDLNLRVTINFPLDVILARAALDRLEEQRSAAGIAAEQVIVELTESRPAEDMGALAVSLEWLRARGYKVAIDDVGPAVPRLTPLLELPFTAIKLYMGLVRRTEENAAVKTFVRATIDAAHARDMAVVAEGVETVEQWQAMRTIGVDAVQGFLVARPLPVEAVPIWLNAWNDTPAFG